MTEDEGIVVDTLFVGCTRPATILGIPFMACVMEIAFVIEAFIWSQNLLVLLFLLPVHVLMYLICLSEPRILELFLLWVCTKGWALLRNFSYWGCKPYWKVNTYSPLSLDVGRSSQKISRRFR